MHCTIKEHVERRQHSINNMDDERPNTKTFSRSKYYAKGTEHEFDKRRTEKRTHAQQRGKFKIRRLLMGMEMGMDGDDYGLRRLMGIERVHRRRLNKENATPRK